MSDHQPAAHPALVVCDFQADLLGRLGKEAPAIVERTAKLLAAARRAKVPVFYVVVGFRPGYPELPQHHPTFEAFRESGRLQTTTPGSDIDPALAPRAGEPIVLKHRVGAFPGTDLQTLLRARHIDTLYLAGVTTSGVVLSNVRHAADVDYRVVVVADCCGDADAEVHRVLVEKVFPKQAKVITSADAIATFGAGSGTTSGALAGR